MGKTELISIFKNCDLNYSSMAMKFYRKRRRCILGNTQIPKSSNCFASATSFITSNSSSSTANEGLAVSHLASSSTQMLTYSQIQERQDFLKKNALVK